MEKSNIFKKFSLSGQVSIVTGGSTNLGFDMACALAEAGLIGMTKDLAGLLSPHGIRVNAISPGGFDKGTLPDRFIEKYSALTPLGRMGRIGYDLKGAILFLASSASDYITGHNLVVDGGFSVWK